MLHPRRLKNWARSDRGALRLALGLLLCVAISGFADTLPPSQVPTFGLQAAWQDAQMHELEHWTPGMHEHHWWHPDHRSRAWVGYWSETIIVMPESDWVVWVRRPSIVERFSGMAADEDPWGLAAEAMGYGPITRDGQLLGDFLTRQGHRRRLGIRAEKMASLRRELAMAMSRGSLIDFTIPIPLPRSVERIVGRGEKSNITVTGRETVSFGGETTHSNKFVTDESGRGQSLFPRLEMKQELSVKLSGTVGEKVHVEVENNSMALGAAGQKIRIRYEGDDDEIIDRIEMGDTQLSLPSSGLVSYSTSNKGLFGIKVLGQLGDLEFTAIASKQEGETSSKTFTNTGQVIQSDYVDDINFLANQFFYLDPPEHIFGDGEYRPDVHNFGLNIFVEDFSPVNPQGDIQYAAIAMADIESDGLADGPDGTPTEVKSFRLLTVDRDYSLITDQIGGFLGIWLNLSLGESDILAVSYISKNASEDTLIVGDFDISLAEGWLAESPDTLTLELIKPEDYTPDSPTWDYMMRNIYSLGGRDLDYSTLEVEIHRVSTRPDPTYPEGFPQFPYMQIFGLDQFGASNVDAGHDSKIDQAWVDTQNGLLRFPAAHAFDPSVESVALWTSSVLDTFYMGPDDPDRNASLYTVKHSELSKDPIYNKYQIRFKSATASSRFNLNAFDILNGSESVILDGRTLTRGTDYRIDYFSGEVEFIGDAASQLNVDSSISITYQFKPLIGGGKSSLLGVHGTYHLGEQSKLSSSWLYESKHSGSRRPRIGEESTRNVVGNLLGNYQAQPEILTRAVNLLPLVDTDITSTVSVSGELAVSFPNPNIDGFSYLDDMEGVEDADDLSLHRSQWVKSSEPFDFISNLGGIDIATISTNRAKAYYWFHPQQTTFRRDFNLNLPDQEAQETVDVLRMEIPIHLDADNVQHYPDIDEADQANQEIGDGIWAGLMRGFRGEGLDLSEAEYLEIWVNDFQQDEDFRLGRIHFDMGDIDEDFFNPELNVFDTEDRFNKTIFDELEEDTGLDGAFDVNEDTVDELPWSDGVGGNDPAGDNYDPVKQSESYPYAYFKVNGLEGNRRMDSEDLDGDEGLDQRNNYYTFSVDLAEEPLVDMTEIYFDSLGTYPESQKAWRLYRLNLSDAKIRSSGNDEPDWSRIKYFRFWVEGMNLPGQSSNIPFNTLEIASIKIVGNRWKSHGLQSIADGHTLQPGEIFPSEDIRVEVINTKDNANFLWPYGTEIDPDTGLPEREQALNFVYEDLQPGHQALIRKDFSSLNLLAYREISFYAYPDTAAVDNEIFFRAAFDSLNYYELATTPPEEGWREMNIRLTDWTDLKLNSEADTVTAVVQDLLVPSRQYTIRKVGNPDLSRVKSLFFGLRNMGDDPISGQTWINDIRVQDVRRDAGYAGKINASANLGGVLNLSANFQETDPEFRGLRATRGSGVTSRNWSVSASSKLQHFVPLAGYNLPVSASYSRSKTTPKYETGSDVEITDAVLREEHSSETVSQKLTLSLNRKASRNFLMRMFLDNLKLNGSLSQRKSTGPQRIELQESVNHSISWQVNFKERKLPLFGYSHLRWVPNSLSMSTRTVRSWQKTWVALGERYTPNPDSQSGSMSDNASLSWNFFPSLRTSVNLSDSRDLEHEKAKKTKWSGVDVNLGFQTAQSQSFTLDYTLPFIKKFKPKIRFQSSYNQSVQNFSGIGSGSTSIGTKRVSSSNSLNTGYNFDLGKWVKNWLGSNGDKKGSQRGSAVIPPGGPGPRRMAPRVLVPVDPSRGPDPRQRRRVSRRFYEEPQVSVETESVAESDSLQSRFEPVKVAMSVLRSLGGLKPVKVDLSRSLNTSYNNVLGDPSFLYRFGFDEDPHLSGFEESGLVEAKRADKRNESRSLKASTGMTLRESIQITSNFDWSQSLKNSGGVVTDNSTTRWPSFSLELSGVDQWRIWGDMMTTSSMGVSYAKSRSETRNEGTNYRTRNESMTISPHWSVTWANKMRTNFTVNWTDNLTGQATQTSRNKGLKISMDFSHHLSAPGGIKIPGLRWLPAFKSRLDLTTNVSYSRSKSLKVLEEGFEEPISGTRTLNLSPGATYQFSDKLTGGMTLRFGQTKTDLTGETRTSVGLTLRSTLIF
jgi:cell surface protein SprA